MTRKNPDARVGRGSGSATHPGLRCGQIKTGAPARSEHVGKPDRLIAIEADDPALPYGPG